jgi:hypothetical protein
MDARLHGFGLRTAYGMDSQIARVENRDQSIPAITLGHFLTLAKDRCLEANLGSK